ncbi:metallophosphoesterase [Nitrosomonas sp. JL21]|uniref:metallophosphoesterase n=1 Tax=Nitrosomonas sp. JL21 TaxID=153949 RepID=UPI00136EBD07|nr:metallophosphoesterase [Nitrosomonas sp. JL21]MBL8498207.1 metallophosphoesterase [Nitrosomonas sp.]MXS78590.1 metallophosphoesterase [Nitrosomonas sp. JL21]
MDTIEQQLEARLGRVHARQRLGIEADHGHRVFGRGLNFFHPENWYSVHALIRLAIQLVGMYERGQRNARNLQVKENLIHLPHLPAAFHDFKILHLTDLHVDMDDRNLVAMIQTVADLEYDICVLTGDYRAQTFGEIDGAVAGMQRLITVLKQPIYGVLGNHDSIRMLPALEAMGINMLMNEAIELNKENSKIYLAGVDDPHYFRVDNLEKAIRNIPIGAVSLLLSHTPEIFRQAAYADFDVMFCGHTHGGQICLPGGIPVTLDSKCPRYVGAGKWRYQHLQGYTSVGAGTSIVNARFNCLPEVTIHHLLQA